ncbi:TonB-dependent receptor [Gluconacetobacter azotocaptans]|uniref:TonB-dependent receptor n=2 Tax=Gluconacetobacter azotocaptans TaxID=142834 RepID=A0A7W4PGJ7_9PROT|nr:TonB-dependent receptor [Gluconacetobacter azotocaptans]GBQ34038.1 TonB-dependent receptor [Gluconacetobacter azotocaptans DSM 13594]
MSLMLDTARAQTGAEVAPSPATQKKPVAPAHPRRASANGTRLEEVTVTARRRTERIERTPISMTTVTGTQFAERGITSIAKIQNLAPNISFGNVAASSGVANAAAIFIRGIGQTDFSFGVDPGVGMYVDGVYVGSPVGSVLNMVDISSVSVLRGPQGTLFGRNTIGGAVAVTSLQPNDHLSARADVKYGTANRIDTRAFVNVPLSSTLFANFSVGSFMQDGYVNAPYQKDERKLGSQDTRVFKGALRWHPIDKLNVVLRGDWTRDRSNGAPFVTTGVNPTATGSMIALNNALAGGTLTNCTAAACYNSRYFSKNTNYGTGPDYSNLVNWSTSGTIDYELTPWLDLKSITAYRKSEGQFTQDRDASPVNINFVKDFYMEKQFSEEFQANGRALNNRLHYSTGVYYFDQSGYDINPVNFYVLSLLSGGDFRDRNYAAYAQSTYAVTRKFNVTVGVRYTEDNKSFLPNQYYISSIGAPILSIPPGTRIVPERWYHNNNARWTPMVNLSYQVTPELMAYTTFSQGFKGGGFTQRLTNIAPSPPSFRPESVNSFEGGLKFYGLDHRLRVSAAGFFTFYDNVQLLVADATHIGPYYTNAGKAHISGFELESQYALGDGWTASGSVGLTDAHYTSLTNSVQGLTLDSMFVLVSKWTANLGLSKRIDMGRYGVLTPRVDAVYRSRYNANVNAIMYNELIQPKYILVNLGARWASESGRYNFSAGLDNATNEKFMAWGSYSGSFGNYQKSFDRGRQWFIQGGVSF